MSTDWNVVCDKCKKVRHLGQRMAMTCSFGFGSNDTEGHKEVAEWVSLHLECGPPLRIEVSDVGFNRVSDDYEYVHDEKVET